MAARLLVVVVLLTGAAAQSPTVAIPADVRAAADRISAADLQRDLEFLSSDELQGRNTGSPGFDMAAEHIAKRLERAGLKPLGDEGGFFQRYTMRELQLDADGAYLEANGRRLKLGADFVMRSFAGPLSGAKAVVYVGHGWTVPDKGIDPYAELDVKGKLVLAHGPRALPKGVEIRQLGRINIGGNSPMIEAERRGAAGIIFIPQSSALANWEQMRGQNLARREIEPSVPSAYAAAPVSSILLSSDATQTLLTGERIGGAELIAAGDRQDYAASFQLEKPVTLHLPVASSTDQRPYNIVALLDGSDSALKREYITIESHLDGAVGSRPVDGDSVYNSADDNASGSAATLAIAEQIARAPRPKRSIIFIWDSGEERGLWGTRYFVGNSPVPLQSIVAHFNIDMIGANRASGSADAEESRVTGPNEVFVIGPGVLSRQAEALLDDVNRAYLDIRFNKEHDTVEREFFYPRTDAGPFLERGILTINFTTGIHGRYHQPADEARYLDPKKIESIAKTVFAALWMFADAGERPRIDRGIPPAVPRYGGGR